MLVPTNSTLAKFVPLGALLEGKQLAICEPRPTSNKYSESYYIGRTLCHQKTIKQGIFYDEDVGEKLVFLTTEEQEFEQYCQQYPNNNAHWLEKDKSGKLVWQQSQGSLETLRKYIDTESSHRYSADDLDKLLEQAERQRVMLISDTAGMGKSTLLTHLSKQIKQKFPSKFVVRIDLNDHTDTLKALKQEEIDKGKAIEFVSEKLLKLKPGLELELFKQCCKQKQKIRIVIMLDGFDEICPFYKETVIDLLQALRQTAVEQLWVTTRSHQREELEDNLQQLSYTLENFSAENQVEFLRKFWFLTGCFTELQNETDEEDEGGTKLEICSEEIFQVGSDKRRDISGIPLKTPNLVKIFDGENESLSQSIEPVNYLPTNQTSLGLHKGFVAGKYELYLENKTGNRMRSDAGKLKLQHILECAREDHQLLALKMLFGEELLAQLQIENHFTLSAECLTKIGIAKKNCEGNLQFIHSSFADYFVADFLVDQLTSGTHHSQNVQDFLLTNIFLEPNYRVIRHFIDGLLSNSKPLKETLKQYGNRMEEIREYCEQTFHQAAYEGKANIIGFYLESLEVGKYRDTINKLLLAQDKRGQTAWHLAACWGNIQVLDKLWDWAAMKLSKQELKDKILLAEDFSGNTAWKAAARTGNTEILQKRLESEKEEMTKEGVNKEFLLASVKLRGTVWQMTPMKGYLEVFQKVWLWAKDILTKDEIKNELLLVKGYWEETVWHMAASKGKLDVLQKLREWAEEILTKEEPKE
jgi:ankyrin repeat protein